MDRGQFEKFILFFLLMGVLLVQASPVHAAPYTANYYLGTLKNSTSFIEEISRYDVLILTPSQIATHQSVVGQIKKKNPDVIILAYVPSQSYNEIFWSNDPVFKNLIVQNNWWLRGSGGEIIRAWPGIKNINMDPEWAMYYLSYINTYIASLPYVDGIFFDMVSENISWINKGNVDFNNDGIKDAAGEADTLWLSRMTYFLTRASEILNTDYIVINGTSHPAVQGVIHGRMFETFPTPWEGDGSWRTVMTNLSRIREAHQKPRLSIINSNTDNSGNMFDYQRMRFGLTSSLLEDYIYFSFDNGDQDHAQLWWYDEYNVNLGNPIARSYSLGNKDKYAPDLWRRDFEQGLVLVNSLDESVTVPLEGDFEKIHGTQDTSVNDGAIIDEVTLDGEDGILLLKTILSLSDVLFTNGSFVRFFDAEGIRVRNGFFAFDDTQKGGVQIASIDMNGNNNPELVVIRGPKVSVWRDDQKLLLRRYPYGANYTGELRVAIGDIDGDKKSDLIVAPSYGYPAPIRVYGYSGKKWRRDLYPFGKEYRGGYTVAIGKFSEKHTSIVIGSGAGSEPRVALYDPFFTLLMDWLPFDASLRQGVSVGSGDVDGDGFDDIIAGTVSSKGPLIRIFTEQGIQKGKTFTPFSSVSESRFDIRIRDVDFDGKEDIVVMTEGVGL